MPNEKHTTADIFEQMVQQAASDFEQPIFQIVTDMDNPGEIEAETYQYIEAWANSPSIVAWGKELIGKDSSTSFMIVQKIEEITSETGIKRIVVRGLGQQGPEGFNYATTSGNEEIKRLGEQEPEGFSVGDVVITKMVNVNDIESRRKYRGSENATQQLKLLILHQAIKVGKEAQFLSSDIEDNGGSLVKKENLAREVRALNANDELPTLSYPEFENLSPENCPSSVEEWILNSLDTFELLNAKLKTFSYVSAGEEFDLSFMVTDYLIPTMIGLLSGTEVKAEQVAMRIYDALDLLDDIKSGRVVLSEDAIDVLDDKFGKLVDLSTFKIYFVRRQTAILLVTKSLFPNASDDFLKAVVVAVEYDPTIKSRSIAKLLDEVSSDSFFELN